MNKGEMLILVNAIKHLGHAKKFINIEDIDLIDNIIIKYQERLNFYNEDSFDCLNPSKQELSLVYSSLLKHLKPFFLEKFETFINRYSDDDDGYVIEKDSRNDKTVELKKLIHKTIFSKELVKGKILVARNKNHSPIKYETTRLLLGEFRKCFFEQNKDFVKNNIILNREEIII